MSEFGLAPFSRVYHLYRGVVNKRSPKERDSCGEGIEMKRAKDGKKGIVITQCLQTVLWSVF